MTFLRVYYLIGMVLMGARVTSSSLQDEVEVLFSRGKMRRDSVVLVVMIAYLVGSCIWPYALYRWLKRSR